MKKDILIGGGWLRNVLVASLSLLTGLICQAQTITSGQTAAALAAALSGPGVIVANPTLTCPSSANGLFTGGTNNLGISDGILLTSGNAANVNNPASFFESTNNGAAGDADLSGLSGNATFDACVLEFDFVANGDSVNFRYQFGSEEYPNFTCTQFNDVFGFFISGPGYGGPTNIALVPGTTVPVAINSVNGGTPTGAGVIANCNNMGPGSPFPAYFINNVGSGAPAYDGLTVVLNAKAAVIPCSTYHFKLGVADASDFILSSGVFLEQGSLTVLPPTIIGCPANITAVSDICGKLVTWTPPTVNSCLPVSSTASHNPGDFFPIGTTTVTYTFTNAGGTSTCTFDVTVTGEVPDCAIAVTKSDTTFTGGGPTDIFLGYGAQSATLTASSTTTGPFTYSWSGPTSYLSCTNCQSPVFTPTIGGTYTFTVTITNTFGCTSTCSVTFCVKDIRVPGNGNNQKVYLCHIPQGNPSNPQTLSISPNAVPAHLGPHIGDALGFCGQTCGSVVARYITGNGSVVPELVTISPNPNNGVFTVTIPHIEDQAQLLVTDMQGKVIQRRMLTELDGQIINVQLSNVPYGVYLLDVYYSGEHYRAKLEIRK